MILVLDQASWDFQKNKRGLSIVPVSFPLIISSGPNEIVYPDMFEKGIEVKHGRAMINNVWYKAEATADRVQRYDQSTSVITEYRKVRILEGDLEGQEVIVSSIHWQVSTDIDLANVQT